MDAEQQEEAPVKKQQQQQQKKGPLGNELYRKLVHRTTGVELQWKHFRNEKELMEFYEMTAYVLHEMAQPRMQKLDSSTCIVRKLQQQQKQKASTDSVFDLGRILPKYLKEVEDRLQKQLSAYFGPTLGDLYESHQRLTAFVEALPAAILLLSATKLITAVRDGQTYEDHPAVKPLTKRVPYLKNLKGRLQAMTTELAPLVAEYAEEEEEKGGAIEVYTRLYRRIESLYGEAWRLFNFPLFIVGFHLNKPAWVPRHLTARQIRRLYDGLDDERLMALMAKIKLASDSTTEFQEVTSVLEKLRKERQKRALMKKMGGAMKEEESGVTGGEGGSKGGGGGLYRIIFDLIFWFFRYFGLLNK